MSTATAGHARGRATRRTWLGLAVLALPTLLASMDLTVLNLAAPAISADLQPSATQLLWIVDVYGFVMAGLLITMGTLGDRVGRRRLLLIGAVLFGITSVLAAFSTSAEALIVTRGLLGVAGATLMPSTLSLASSMFHDPAQRTVAISVIIASFSAGTALGPLLGGAMLEHFWWGSVFLLAVPVMALLLVLAPRLVPEYRAAGAGPIDVLSAALSLAAILLLTYALKQLVEHGLAPPSALAIAAGLLSGWAFVRRQRRLADPLLDLRLFRRVFTISVATLVAGFVVLFGAYFLVGQFLQLVLGLSPLEAGLLTVPSAAGVIAGSTLAPWLARRIRPGLVISAGLLLSAGGVGMLAQVDSSSGVGLLVLGSVVLSAGMGPMMALTTDLIVKASPPERAGTASALSETAGDLGGALGIAIMGSVAASAYRGQLADALPPGVPDALAATARETLGGAVTAYEALPAQLGGPLLAAARDAFAGGLALTAAIGVGVMVATAILTATLLRDEPAPDASR